MGIDAREGRGGNGRQWLWKFVVKNPQSLLERKIGQDGMIWSWRFGTLHSKYYGKIDQEKVRSS